MPVNAKTHQVEEIPSADVTSVATVDILQEPAQMMKGTSAIPAKKQDTLPEIAPKVKVEEVTKKNAITAQKLAITQGTAPRKHLKVAEIKAHLFSAIAAIKLDTLHVIVTVIPKKNAISVAKRDI